MTDTISQKHRSWNMSRIRSKDTEPEMIVRSALHRMGFRFRLHAQDLPGKPDIVLPKFKTVIFVHGCFWHHHPRCKYAYSPKTRVAFWKRKFHDNVRNDRRVKQLLAKLGWRVSVVWECRVNKPGCTTSIVRAIQAGGAHGRRAVSGADVARGGTIGRQACSFV
jgi:DNA mismatch endonuclease (patch repair protein)